MIIWTCIYYKSPSPRRRIDRSRRQTNWRGEGGELEKKQKKRQMRRRRRRRRRRRNKKKTTTEKNRERAKRAL